MSTVRWDPKVGEQVRAYRITKGWGREHLARLTGLSLNTIYRIETGRQRIGRDAASELSNHLGIPLSVLLAPVAKAC